MISLDHPPRRAGCVVSETAVYWAGHPMKSRAGLGLVVASLLLVVSVPVLADQRDKAKTQVEFAIKVAQKGLWKDAAMRFEAATVADPSYAAAWNNLGIAYEQLGRFDDARRAYEKAMELDPDNNFIKVNYDYFREIYDRQNRRRGR
jgi:Tfp pilus assembly protein PilF